MPDPAKKAMTSVLRLDTGRLTTCGWLPARTSASGYEIGLPADLYQWTYWTVA
jgi:hypothetical protein